MPTAFDLLFVALLAIGWPLYEYFIDWPRFQRWLIRIPDRARRREYWLTICQQWLLVAIGIALWRWTERPWSEVGLNMPHGWRMWASALALAWLGAMYARQAVKLAHSPPARARVHKHIAALEALLPHTATELRWFLVMSLTAGVCEEFLFRGYFITTLARWLGWWGAGAISAPIFGLLHAYQGRSGIVRTALVGVLMTLVVAVTRSLIPAMALHALVDVGSGIVTWIVLSDFEMTDR